MAAKRAVKMAVQAASLRPTVVGLHQAVASGHYLATLAEMRVLDRGGNAVDAGVTVAMALAVLQPDMVSFAGVAPTLIYLRKEDRGPIADEVAAYHARNKGFVTKADLAGFEVPVESSIKINYRGYEVHSCDVWCQGIVLLETLKILEGFDHGYNPGRLNLEVNMPREVIEKMRQLGYDVDVWPLYPASNAAVCAVKVDPETGMRHAGADPRREGYALAW